jgi:hypothetical protein
MTQTSTRQHELEALALDLATLPELQAAGEAAARIFEDYPNAFTSDGRGSLEDAARQHFYGAIQLATNSDPAHPEILATCLYDHLLPDGRTFPSSLHGGLENPDNVYRIIPVGPQWRYTLSGVRDEVPPAQVTYELMDTVPGLGGLGDQLGLLTDRDMEYAEDGSFTITIDADPADGRRPNHIQCPPEARALFVRDTLSDWTTQRPNRLRIASVQGPERAPRSLADITSEAADYIPAYARFWNDFRDSFVAKMNMKTNAFDPPAQRTGAWGYIANTQFRLEPDEALVFTTEVADAPYHAVLIGNHWWIAHEASRRSGAFNNAQAWRNEDGSTTFVIAARDPGVANWLDSAGLCSGVVQVRWQGAAPGAAAPPPIRDTRVVHTHELAGLTPAVTPQQRDEEQAARHASYLHRLDYL